MLPSTRRLHACALVAVASALIACGESPVEVPEATTIEVTSAIDRLIDVDRTAQLSAVVKDQNGEVMEAGVTWISGSPTIASVSGTGVVTAHAEGVATISASAGGANGALAMEVIDADLEAIEALLGDPLVPHLSGPLGPTGSDIDNALADCDAATVSGHLVQLDACLETIRETAAAATAADDRALLAVLSLLADHATRKLNL